MKSERTYPVYKVNKHAEGLLVGGHPWVYENDILEAPGTAPENGTLVDVVSPKGAISAPVFSLCKARSGYALFPATPTTPLTPPSGAAGWSTHGRTAKRCWSLPTSLPAASSLAKQTSSPV